MILKDARLFVAHFTKGEYTPEEYVTFLQWLQDASIDELGIIADEHEALFEQWSLPAVGPSSEWVHQLEQRLDEQEKLAPVRTMRRFSLKPVWVAAASVVLLSTGGYFWYNYSQSAEKKTDVAQQDAGVLYKTFSVPRGGEQQAFVLADGSKIWLNAASTLKYPVNFGGNERTVELSGEGYFEVTGSATRPFHVKIKGAEIEVLGTHFNVKAYEDEATSQTTLIDGAVKVISGTQSVQLKPGEQVETSSETNTTGAFSQMTLTKGVDIDHVLLWKSGLLEFRDEALFTVMQAISRSYDVEVRYESGVPTKRFTGNFSRKSNIQKILNQLTSQNIHSAFDGKVITIMH